MRLAGKICCVCKGYLPEPHTHGEKYCVHCSSAGAPKHRIYMYVMHIQGWYCQFLEEDLKTPLPRKIALKDAGKVVEMAERGGYKLDLEGKHALEVAMANGRGGIWLSLSEEQYAKLKRR